MHTKQLWFSELSLSNDPMEGRWIREVFRYCCADNSLSSYRLDKLMEYLDHLIGICSAAGFCMSEQGDLLSQWRSYAENGGGVSIGFNQGYFERLGSHRQDRNDIFNVSLINVEYKESDQKALINEHLDHILKYVNEGALEPPTLATIGGDPDGEIRRRRVGALAQRFLHYFPHLFKIKNPAFAEEREWRALSYLINSLLEEPKNLQHLRFRAQSDRIIPYVAIELETLDIPSISEVIVGPRNITPTPVIERMLRAQGWGKVTVKRSKATYR